MASNTVALDESAPRPGGLAALPWASCASSACAHSAGSDAHADAASPGGPCGALPPTWLVPAASRTIASSTCARGEQPGGSTRGGASFWLSMRAPRERLPGKRLCSLGAAAAIGVGASAAGARRSSGAKAACWASSGLALGGSAEGARVGNAGGAPLPCGTTSMRTPTARASIAAPRPTLRAGARTLRHVRESGWASARPGALHGKAGSAAAASREVQRPAIARTRRLHLRACNTALYLHALRQDA